MGVCDLGAVFAHPYGTEVTDVAYDHDPVTDESSVYVVGTNGGGVSAYLARFSPTFKLMVPGVVWNAPPGGYVRLDGVAVRQGGPEETENVFVTGELFDPATMTHPNMFLRSFSPRTTSTLCSIEWDVGSASRGLSVDADRNNAYVGGRFQNPKTGAFENITVQIRDANEPTCSVGWSASLKLDTITPDHPEAGMHDVQFVGAKNGGGGKLFATGIIRTDTYNPGGHANAMLVKWNTESGTPDFAVSYISRGYDYAGRGIAVDRPEQHPYLAVYFGNNTDRDAT
jgi:hypothetical protein